MGLGLGTAALGRLQYINIREEDTSSLDLVAFKQKGLEVLDQAYKSGIRYFDTAPGYGLAEDLLLEWLQTKNDQSIEVATKWGYTYVANFVANAEVHEIKEHSLFKLNEQWATSKAFGTHLKVYQIHSATLETGVLENDAILNQLALLKDEHELKIGITTTGTNQVEVIEKALEVVVNGQPLFDAFQVTYNILDQSLLNIYPILFNEKKSIIIKEALANGRLFRNCRFQHYNEVYDALEKLANKYEVGVDVIALKFCQQSIPHSMALSGASNLEHLVSNLKVNTIDLLEEELTKLANFNIDATDYWQERKQLTWN